MAHELAVKGRSLLIAAASIAAFACSGGGSDSGGAGGSASAHGGASNGGNSETSSGGSASGGAATAQGGNATSLGGASNGGASNGGATLGQGGASTASGGKASSGGTSAQGGTSTSSGGKGSGGNSSGGNGGGSNSGGSTNGGSTNGGQTSSGGSSSGAGGSSNANAAATIGAWLNPTNGSPKGCLPYGSPSGDTKTQIVNAIIGACEQFGPPESSNPGWKMEYCWAHLVGAILKESSYNVMAIAEPGSDPTVGLLQDRFSSTVCDLYTQGPRSRLEAMGCTFPSDFAAHASEQCSSTFWKTTGGDSAHTAWMQTPACNVGLGAWYYYTYATGGGNSTTTVYTYQYCHATGSSGPQPANLVTGLLSHLRGPSTSWADIPDMASVPSVGTDYVNAIKTVFDCAIGSVSGTHPFFIELNPNKSQYCPP